MIIGYGISPMVPMLLQSDTDTCMGYGKIQLGYAAKIQDTSMSYFMEKKMKLDEFVRNWKK